MSKTETHRLPSLQPLSLFISVYPLLTEGVIPQTSPWKPQSHPQCVLLLHLPSSAAAVSGPSQSHVDVRSGFLRLTLSPPSLRCLCLGSDASRISGQFQQLSDHLLTLSPSPGSSWLAVRLQRPLSHAGSPREIHGEAGPAHLSPHSQPLPSALSVATLPWGAEDSLIACHFMWAGSLLPNPFLHPLNSDWGTADILQWYEEHVRDTVLHFLVIICDLADSYWSLNPDNQDQCQLKSLLNKWIRRGSFSCFKSQGRLRYYSVTFVLKMSIYIGFTFTYLCVRTIKGWCSELSFRERTVILDSLPPGASILAALSFYPFLPPLFRMTVFEHGWPGLGIRKAMLNNMGLNSTGPLTFFFSKYTVGPLYPRVLQPWIRNSIFSLWLGVCRCGRPCAFFYTALYRDLSIHRFW